MRPEENPLDLNNVPEDYTRDRDINYYDDTSSSAAVAGGGDYTMKKKSGGDRAEGGGDKVYECRFCSLKFCKSQALGGHMNRHRQERETETLNKARQLLLTNNFGPVNNIGYVTSDQSISRGGYKRKCNIDDPIKSMYPYMYTSPQLIPYTTQYPASQPIINDYIVGRVISPIEGNYTCTGAPVDHGYDAGREGLSAKDLSL